uniref:Uncharacterized protein n=1 Tax=Trichogramma kaykai TaxID=54128 RepID=A0ABD2VVE9_9HYME
MLSDYIQTISELRKFQLLFLAIVNVVTFFLCISHRPQPVINRQQAATYQYQPQYPTQQQHTQAIYAAQQTRLAPKPAQPIYSPIEQPRLNLQSQLIQSQLYTSDEQPQYKNGPVQFGPAPVQEHHLQARAQPQARSGANGGLLDQLARDYALPAGGAAPLHDISFGYY